MKALITGGGGFLGGRIAQYLNEKGLEVIVGTSRERINWSSNTGLNLVGIAWENQSALEKLCERVDFVVHAAGMDAMQCAIDPIRAKKFNGAYTGNLAQAAKNAGVKKFIYLSTAHVYKSPLIGAFTEESKPENKHPYSTSHLCGEKKILELCQIGPLCMEGVVLRLSNVFGIPASENISFWKLLVNDLCNQAVNTRAIKLMTNGMQKRDFIPINDLLKVVGKLIKNEMHFSGVLNVGSGKSSSVYEIAQLVQQCTNDSLNYLPEIITNKEDQEVYEGDLIYASNIIKNLGIEIEDNKKKEIKNIINFLNKR